MTILSNVPLTPAVDWPESWRTSHHFDRVELWGEDQYTGYATMYADRRAHVLAAVDALATRPLRVLDIAAAQGNFSIAMAERGHHVTWNDFRGELEGYVRLKSPLAAGMDFVSGNILDVAEHYRGAFDLVLALEVIEHVAHPDAFLRAVGELVADDGFIVISTPNGGYVLNDLPRFSDCPDPSVFEAQQFKPDADGHIFLLHEDEIHDQAAMAGLTVVRHELFSNPLTCGHVKTHMLHKILPVDWIRRVERMTVRLPRRIGRWLNAASLTVLRPDRPPAGTGMTP